MKKSRPKPRERANFRTRKRPQLGPRKLFGLPHEQKISVNNVGFRGVKSERNADSFGYEFWASIHWGPETLEKQGNSQEFAIQIRREIRGQNSPDQNIKNSPQIRSAKLRWPGNSQHESGRFARIDSRGLICRKKKNYF